MQIHELNSFVGSPTSTDYLAIDDGTETTKISLKDSVDGIIADALPSMTQAEAEAGTSTSKKVITPKVLHDYVKKEATAVQVLKVLKSSVSSLPITITNAAITSDMEVVHCVLSDPAAQLNDWTATTSNGSLTITGIISGTTNITLYLAAPRT